MEMSPVWKLTPEQKLEAVERYVGGQGATEIAADYGVSNVAILGVLRRRGVQVRTNSEAQTKHTLRHDALDILTPDAAYWCGFLFADGTIMPPRPGHGGGGIALVLAERDRDHLAKFRGFLGSSHAITAIAPHRYNASDYFAHPAARFAVNSDRLADRLRSLGRYDPPLNSELASSRDFWRGVVDGDGSLGLYGGKPHLRVCGSDWLMEAFRSFVVDRHHLCHATVRPHKSIYEVHLCGPSAANAVSLLYSDASTVLDRKCNGALNIYARAGLGSGQAHAA
jgi:hypothetical protein